MNIQQYVLASGDHESGVIINLTSESDDLSENQKELERAPGSPAPIRGYKPTYLYIKLILNVYFRIFIVQQL